MRGELVRLHSKSDVQPMERSIAALFETRSYMDDEAEHFFPKKLLIDHL